MNEHKMAAPKDAKPDELRVMKVSAGHAYVWLGDEWICTARPAWAGMAGRNFAIWLRDDWTERT